MAVKGFVPYSGLIRGVVFDMDGTGIDYNYGVHNTSWDALMHFLGKKEKGLVAKYDAIVASHINRPAQYTEWFNELLELIEGKETAYAKKNMLPPPYIEGFRKTCRELGKHNVKRGIVSCGVNFVGEYIVNELNLDFLLMNKLYEEDGMFTGKGDLKVNPFRKDEALKDLCNQLKGGILPENITLPEIAVVGNDITDVPMFKVTDLNFAVKGDKMAKRAARYSIRSPTSILKVLAAI